MKAQTDPSALEQCVRAVTEDEISFYEENGWVMLRGLISRELASDLLHLAEAAASTDPPSGSDEANSLLDALARTEGMCSNAQRMIHRLRLSDVNAPVRSIGNGIGCKPPVSKMLSGKPDAELLPYVKSCWYHQDSVEHGSDRIGETRFWIALAELTPDMGTMRFFSGAHREGPLGSVLTQLGIDGESDLLHLFPKLAELYPLCPPLSYEPGDATVHHGYMVHGGPPNETDRPRWNCAVDYAPADMRYIGGSRKGNPGSQRTVMADEEKYPVIWPRH